MDDLSMEEVHEEETITKKPNKKTKTRTENDDVLSRKRNEKGIILSITKPSYTLKTGDDVLSLRCQHRIRLRYLLRQLVRRQNWDEAAGVLSILLKATIRDKCYLTTNRTKYWAALELLDHMGAAKGKPRRIQQVYEIAMKKSYAVTKNNQLLKGKFDVQLEYLLFCLSQGNTDAAYQAVISLLQESGFANDPIANLVVGLAFSQLWYNDIHKEIPLHDSIKSPSPIQSDMSGPPKILSGDHSNGQSIVQVEVSNSSFQNDSNTSIRMGKTFDIVKDNNQDRLVSMELDHNLKKEVPEYVELDLISAESDQAGNASLFPHTGNKQYSSIFYARDLEYILMPLRHPGTNNFEDFITLQRKIQTDHYKDAVKHLKAALHSTPPAFEAFLPLIQMLLFGDQVKEAIEEVENMVRISGAALPFRLRASLLEHFSNEDASKLGSCYEEALEKDPTCGHSLAKLINLHYDGYYSLQKLIEMIALHLDAKYADCQIWQEFASCLLRLSECEKDRMSTCVDSYGNSCTKSSKNLPGMFTDNVSMKSWKLRCRWWLTRHFTQTRLTSEVADGDMELIVYKAASACHLYGADFAYVVNARKNLKKKRYQDRSILKVHMKNAIGFYTK